MVVSGDGGGPRFVATPSCPWPLLSKQAIEKGSPSRREGLSYKEELNFSRSVCNLMIRTGAAQSHEDVSTASRYQCKDRITALHLSLLMALLVSPALQTQERRA